MDYITTDELKTYIGDVIPDEDAPKYIHAASRNIDSLTYNRIYKYGFENLTGFQSEIIKETTAQLAGFEYENADAIKSIFNSYSVNGVSMSFGDNANIQHINGVLIPTTLYNLLSQSGLTTANLAI